MIPAGEDRAEWEALRAELFPGERINLNPGTLGTVSRPVRAAMAAFSEEEDGAYPLGQYQRGREALRRARSRAEAIWGVAPALCAGTTQTMDRITLALAAGERPIRVRTSGHEHHGGVGGFEHHPAFVVVYSPVDELADEAAFRERVRRERTDVLLLSQRTWTDGRALPVAACCAIVREESDALTIVDAAQVVGILPPALEGADVVVASAHKWLGGPPGTGFCWLSERARARLGPLHPVGDPLDPEGPHPGFEPAGGQDFSLWAGLDAALALHQSVGPDRVLDRCRRLARVLADALTDALPGVTVDMLDAVVCARFPAGDDPYPLYAALNARGVHTKCVKAALPTGEALSLLRMGVPWYESEDRLAAVGALVRELRG